MSEGTLLIRADANVAMGTGHVMRCLALAQAWQEAGGHCTFAVSHPLPPIRQRLLLEGIDVVPVEAPAGSSEDAGCTAEMAHRLTAEWVVVDGYHFGADYQRELKAAGLQILFLDDNAHAGHYVADLVLNPNANADENLYESREPYTRLLLGLRYVLLRREFEPWRDWNREVQDLGCKILVTMGGTDPDNITLRAIQALARSDVEGLEATVVVGASNPHVESLEREISRAARLINLRQNASDMPGLMAWADMALVAAGGTLWELLFMGCSVLSCARDTFQGTIVSQLGCEGVVRDLGQAQSLDPASLGAAIIELARSRESRSRMSAMGRERVDGRGAARVCKLLINQEIRTAVVTLEPISPADRAIFLAMAELHFRELDPSFVPARDWRMHYFEGILGNSRLSLRWIVTRGQKAGFILFGVEEHFALPRRSGVIHELYVSPEFRRQGIARICARQAIDEMQRHDPSKVQLEIVENNRAAAALWTSLGFEKVAERWALRKIKK